MYLSAKSSIENDSQKASATSDTVRAIDVLRIVIAIDVDVGDGGERHGVREKHEHHVVDGEWHDSILQPTMDGLCVELFVFVLVCTNLLCL